MCSHGEFREYPSLSRYRRWLGHSKLHRILSEPREENAVSGAPWNLTAYPCPCPPRCDSGLVRTGTLPSQPWQPRSFHPRYSCRVQLEFSIGAPGRASNVAAKNVWGKRHAVDFAAIGRRSAGDPRPTNHLVIRRSDEARSWWSFALFSR